MQNQCLADVAREALKMMADVGPDPLKAPKSMKMDDESAPARRQMARGEATMASALAEKYLS